MVLNEKNLSLSRKVWDDILIKYRVAEELDKDEKTSEMFAKETHLSINRAAYILRMEYRAGNLTRRLYHNRSWAYRPVKA